MKINCFEDTDTLHIELRPAAVAETRDLDENTLLDPDAKRSVCGITIEQARDRADVPAFSDELVTK